jgi:hypothetical protein
LVKPSVTLLLNAAIVMARAKTWASGRNTRSFSPLASSVGKHALAPRISYRRFEWVSWHPLGVPVVPEV